MTDEWGVYSELTLLMLLKLQLKTIAGHSMAFKLTGCYDLRGLAVSLYFDFAVVGVCCMKVS